jgi:hypothetical protein
MRFFFIALAMLGLLIAAQHLRLAMSCWRIAGAEEAAKCGAKAIEAGKTKASGAK